MLKIRMPKWLTLSLPFLAAPSHLTLSAFFFLKKKIPANKHGALYADPEAFRSDDPEGTATHTTARPRAAVASEVAVDGKFVAESGGGPADESMHETVLQDTEAFLDTFDSNMQTAIAAMDTALQKQMNEGGADTGVVMPIIDTHQDTQGLMAFYPKDWYGTLSRRHFIHSEGGLYYQVPSRGPVRKLPRCMLTTMRNFHFQHDDVT